MKNIQKNTYLALSMVLLIFLAGCQATQTSKTAQPIKIGVMMPLSGDAASYGVSVKKAVELAANDLGNKNIQLVFEDTKCDGKESVNAINKLISFDKVVAVIGELCSGATLPAAPIASENKVVLISPASTSPKITDAGEYVFRTVPSDALQGAFGAKLVYDSGYRRLAILYSNEEYGVGFTKVLTENFEKLKGKVVASEAVERKSVDLRAQLTKIKAANADAIYIISNSPDSAVAALKQIKELGIDARIYGSEGLMSQDIVNDAGGSAEGLTVTSVSSGSPGFISRHKEYYNEEPGPFAAQGYDAFMALGFAVKDGAKTGTEIKQKLEKIKFEGASGLIEFDKNGDVSGNYDVLEVKNGKFMPR